MSGGAPSSSAGGLTAVRGVPTIRRWLGPLLNVPTPVIFVVAAAIACALLWRRGALGEVGSSLRGADPRMVAAIMLVYAASSLAQSARWHALVRMVGGQPPWAASAEVFLTSVIVNYAAPIGLAVPTRAALTVRDLGLKRGPSAAVVGWEAGLDVAALALISTLWLIGSGPTLFLTIGVNSREVALVVAAGAGLALAALVASKTTTLGSRLAGPARSFLAYPGERPRLALLAALLTLAYWCAQSMVMASLLKIFGIAATP
jgi:uncharacterized membrane protein YbhN (UPF0104 family)